MVDSTTPIDYRTQVAQRADWARKMDRILRSMSVPWRRRAMRWALEQQREQRRKHWSLRRRKWVTIENCPRIRRHALIVPRAEAWDELFEAAGEYLERPELSERHRLERAIEALE